MRSIEIYGQQGCRYCVDAIQFCWQRDLPVTYRDISILTDRQEMLARNPAAKTVPQIFVGDRLIGGFTELAGTPLEQLQQMIGE